ncbi:CdaR family protein [Sporolactobacillus terrae]|nr:CdaR family protein [Sporolactobacillus terrae]UAK16151.1 hypothetical protein K7399_14470 [Sporolactobacillus terrae]
MDKLFNNNWLVKIISFVLALMLYGVVSAGDGGNAPGSTANVAVNPTQQTTVVNEKLAIRYDESQYVVSGAPQTINVHLNGSNESILKAKLPSTKSVYLDLTGMKPGTYDAQVHTRGFPSGLTVRPSPKTVRVTIQKKTSKELPVGVDVLNKDALADGYSIGDPAIDTKTVTVTGGENTVDSIAFIKGVVDVKNAADTVDKMISLHAYNNNGDQVDVTIKPSSIHVRVPIEQVLKKLPIKTETTGTPAKGYAVSSVEQSTNEVAVTAQDSEALNRIKALDPLPVSVDGLKKDKTFSVSVPVPSDAESVDPEKIEVTVHIEREDSDETSVESEDRSADSSTAAANSESADSSADSTSDSSTDKQTKDFTNIPIKVTGLENGKTASFVKDDQVAVSVSGTEDDLNQLTKNDLEAEVDLSGLDSGTHKVPVTAVTVNLSDKYKIKTLPETVSVRIS